MPSTQPTRENKNLLPTSSVDQDRAILMQYSDVVDKMWINRHLKLLNKIGPDKYSALAEQARGRNVKVPKAYMATLVNKELRRFK